MSKKNVLTRILYVAVTILAKSCIYIELTVVLIV